MTTLTKILIGLGGFMVVLALGYMIYNQEKIKSQQTALQSSIVAQQQLVDGIVRSQSSYASKADIDAFAKDNNLNLQAIQDNLKKLNSQISSINVVTSDSTGQHSTNIASTNTGPSNPKPSVPVVVACNGSTATCPNQDPFGYQQKQQNLALNEDFPNLKVPIGNVGFSAWQQKPWDIQISPREYNVDTVVGTDANERQTFYNKFTVKVDNKTYDIPIKNATTKQEVPKASFSFWNPRLYLGLDAGINVSGLKGNVTPDINVQVASYGKYKSQPDFSIAQVGVGYDMVSKAPTFSFRPVSYNVGQHIPLMTNLYVGPAVQLSTQGNWSATIGLTVGL